MMAKKVMAGSSGVSITSPNHPDNTVYWGMGNISGSTLLDDSANSVSGNIVGATSGTETGDDFLDFSAASDRIDPDAGLMGGLVTWEAVVILKIEDGANGGVFEYDWEGGVTQDQGDVILLNEPASSRMRFLYRQSPPSSVATVTTSAALPASTKVVMFFGVDSSDAFIEFSSTRTTAAATAVTTASGGESTLGNRENNALPVGGKIYTFVLFNRNLTVDERLEWEAFI